MNQYPLDRDNIGSCEIREDEQLDRMDELEQAAQQLVWFPGAAETKRTIDELQEAASARYHKLHEYEPLHADALIARCVHVAGAAALQRVIDRRFFSKITPHLLKEDLMDNTPPVEDTVHLLDPPRTDTLRGRALRDFRNISAAWILDSRRSTIKEILTDPDHPYLPLLRRQRVSQIIAHRKVMSWNDEVERRGKTRPIRRPSKSLSSVTRTIIGVENMYLAGRIAVAAGVSYCLRYPNSPRNADDMTSSFLDDIDVYGGLTGGSTSSLIKAFPPIGRAKYDTILFEAFTAGTSEAEIVQAGQSIIGSDGATHGWLGLQGDGLRRSALGLCPAYFELSDLEISAESGASRYLDAAGVDKSKVMRSDGAYRGISVLLAFAPHIARHTIYAAWPQS
jgi:hypothetical protein